MEVRVIGGGAVGPSDAETPGDLGEIPVVGQPDEAGQEQLPRQDSGADHQQRDLTRLRPTRHRSPPFDASLGDRSITAESILFRRRAKSGWPAKARPTPASAAGPTRPASKRTPAEASRTRPPAQPR